MLTPLPPSSVDGIDRVLRALWPYRAVDPTVRPRVDALLEQRLLLVNRAEPPA